MADVTAKRIDELPAASSVGDNDLFVLEQSGVAKKATGSTIATQFGGTAVLDVKVNNASVVTNRVANISIPDATASVKGVVTVDSTLVLNSTNPVQSKVIQTALGNKADSSSVHSIPSGGTTGQVLKKTSGTDYAVEWANESGGGGSGAFFAEYGVTPFQDIQDAYNDGLSVFCVSSDQESDEVFTLVQMDTDTQYLAATFIGGDWSKYITYVEVDEQESWHMTRINIPTAASEIGAIAAPSSPTSGDVLTWNGTAWVAAAPTGGGGGVLGVTQDQDGYLVLSPVSAVTEEDIDDTGAVTAALDPNVLYHFTGAITSLTITLNTPQTGMIAHYHFDFTSGSTAATLTLPQTVVMPSGFSVAANTRYEIDILNNYACVQSWAVSSS